MAPVVSYGGKQFKNYFSNTVYVANELCDKDQSSINIIDDSDWCEFPDIAAAAQQVGADAVGMALCTDMARRVWGVGIAAGTKPRAQAAKMAFCIALANNASETKLKLVCTEFPEFAELLEAGGMNVPNGPTPAKK